MNNEWNKIIYRVWSPFYDKFFNSGAFLKARKKLFEDVELHEGSKVLFVGVGTGADLAFIDPKKTEITAIDYSLDMLAKAQSRFQNCGIKFIEMDAQNLQFESESFDLVVGSLILSVVPDPDKTLQEMIRVTKGNGKLLLFDKFSPKNGKLSIGKRLVRPIISWFGTDIGLSFERTIEPYFDFIHIISDDPILFGNMYRKIKMVKR